MVKQQNKAAKLQITSVVELEKQNIHKSLQTTQKIYWSLVKTDHLYTPPKNQ